MISTQKSQLSLLDRAFNTRTKRNRTDKLLHDMKLMSTGTALNLYIRMDNDTNRWRSSLPIKKVVLPFFDNYLRFLFQ